MLRGRSSILFNSVDSEDTIIARTSCSLVAAVSCCSPGLRLVLMLYVLPLQTHARVSCVQRVRTLHLTTRRSCIRFTMPDPDPGLLLSSVLSPSPATRPRLTDEARTSLPSLRCVIRSNFVCLVWSWRYCTIINQN